MVSPRPNSVAPGGPALGHVAEKRPKTSPLGRSPALQDTINQQRGVQPLTKLTNAS